jgi:hypothetical protein
MGGAVYPNRRRPCHALKDLIPKRLGWNMSFLSTLSLYGLMNIPRVSSCAIDDRFYFLYFCEDIMRG